ncbi:MAG: hypothetical protein IKR19_08105 [Acholeplasmatales bacterium]|nr:hypothetical protein [Acholeplasmatales bacterium]
MAGISSYANLTDLRDYLDGGNRDMDQTVIGLLSTNTNGIEGIPYQFLPSVDRRISGTTVGRKYADKIFSRMPLLFLTPCEPLFMDDFNDGAGHAMANALLGNISAESALEMLGEGNNQRKYYSTEFAYRDYYNILDPMLMSVALYLGIQDEYIPFNGGRTRIRDISSWQYELNNSFKTFYSSAENLVFYLDGLNNVSESFTNTPTESSLASMVNGLSEQVNELKFLFGANGNLMSQLADAGSEASESIGKGLSSLAEGLAGGIIGSVTENIPAFMRGAKIVFPKIWGDSQFDRSYSLEFKLRSPDHDSLSLFLNVLKPYCKLLALAIPRSYNNDPNLYRSPFLVRAAAKGMFNVDMGMITSLSVSKGAECCWNDDGLPTQIDVSITIEDLYSSLHASGFGNGLLSYSDAITMVQNTAYQDYLANLAGLNVAQMEMGRKTVMFNYLIGRKLARDPATVGLTLDQKISNLIGRLYNTI